MPAPVYQGPASGLFSQNHQNNPYWLYDIVEKYQYDAGTLAIPVAYTTNQPLMGQRQPQEIVATAAPYSRRIVMFNIIRQNSLPVVPAPTPLANEVLASAEVQNHSPRLYTDGVTRLYATEGIYIFDHTIPVIPGVDSLRMGSTDADVTDPNSYLLPPGQFNPRA